MAKCERCGASFDYEEREGVCPRCCFYNRPPGAARQDTEWMKYYNVEDNSYQLPKSEGLADLFPEEKTGWASRLRKNRRTAQTDRRERSARRNDGTDSGRSRRERKQRQAASRTADTSGGNAARDRRTAARAYRTKSADSRLSRLGKVVGFVILVCILLIAVTAFLQIADVKGWKFGGSEEPKAADMMRVETRTPEEAAAGITAGDITYQVGEARTLFREGEISDLPAGEKCIGIWLEDNESVLEYTGYGWERPYVFDGSDYRQMLDVGSLDDADIFTTNGILSFPVYGAGYEDESGYGIFFVDADATSVVLSLPCQTVDADDTDRMEYQEVIDVEIPLTE